MLRHLTSMARLLPAASDITTGGARLGGVMRQGKPMGARSAGYGWTTVAQKVPGRSSG
jgi:hypothetical protein